MIATPDDAVAPGVSIPVQKVPPVSKQFLLVRVSNTVSPGSFSLQLISEETTDALEELMTIMQ